MTWWARAELRHEWRLAGPGFRRASAGVAALALITSALVVPALTRHGWEGHEAIYLDRFEGRPSAEEDEGSPLLTSPLPTVLYGAMGRVPGLPPASMVWLNLLLGALAAVVAGWTAWRLLDDPLAGALTGALVALHPLHAFWSSSAYQVMLPCALGQLALAAVLAGAARRSLRLAALGAALAALALSARVEYALLAPALAAVWLLGGRRRWRAVAVWAPAAALGIGLAALHLLPLGGAAATRDAGEPLAYFVGLLRDHALWPDPWHPYDGWGTWPALAAGVALLAGPGGGVGRRALAAVAALALAFWLPYACFWDYATRHLLLPVAGVAMVAAAGLAGTWRGGGPRRVFAVLAAVGCLGSSLSSLGTVRDRYYADENVLERALPEVDWAAPRSLDDAIADGCYLVSEWPELWAAAAAGELDVGSHVNLDDPLEGPAIWRDHGGCVLWLLDADDLRWTSRDVHSRAWKLQHRFDWELLGAHVGERGQRAAVYQLVAWD